MDRASATHLMADSSLRLAINVNSDYNIGSKKKRNGYISFANAPDANKVVGMFFWQKLVNGVQQNILFRRSGTSLYKYLFGTDTTWQLVDGGWTTDVRCSFAALQGKLFASDGIRFRYSSDGTTWQDVSNVLPNTPPFGKYLSIFQGRLYSAGSSKDVAPNGQSPQSAGTGISTLYFSHVDDGTDWDGTNQLIDPSTFQYEYIDPDNNGYISGLNKVLDRVVIFKNSADYKWDGFTLTDINLVPCTSNWGVVSLKDHLMFPNYDGMWDYSGTTPEIVSVPLGDIWPAISGNDINDMAGVTFNRHTYHSVGDITIDGETWRNVVLDLDFDQSAWYFHTFANKPTCWVTAIDQNNNNVLIFGDTAGNTYISGMGASSAVISSYNIGNNDNGKPIQMVVQFKTLDAGAMESNKVFDKVFITADVQGEMHFMIAFDGGDFQDMGQLRKYTTKFYLDGGSWNKSVDIRLVDNGLYAQPIIKEIAYDVSAGAGEDSSKRGRGRK